MRILWAEMAGKAQTSAQTMKFVYSEAVNRALRQRCRGLAAASSTTTLDKGPPLPPELLLAVLQSGDVDLSVVSGKSGRLQIDADATAAVDNVDYEIVNLAEIYREISSAIEQVRRRSAPQDAAPAPGTIQNDRPSTRTAVTAAKTPAATDDKTKTHRTMAKDFDKRQKDGKKVQFRTTARQESTGD